LLMINLNLLNFELFGKMINLFMYQKLIMSTHLLNLIIINPIIHLPLSKLHLIKFIGNYYLIKLKRFNYSKFYSLFS